ncbi:MAG: hypothetical protein V9E98_00100 [Candidatus Nanopelagicales bacterium]
MLEARAVRRTITPERLPIELGGYAQGERASSIDSDLEMNCVALTDGVETAVIVSLDLLYVTHALRKAVLAGVADAGVDDSSLFMAASHTHYAPAIDETKPLLGTPDIGFRDQMLSTIVEAIRDAVLRARIGRCPCECLWARGHRRQSSEGARGTDWPRWS